MNIIKLRSKLLARTLLLEFSLLLSCLSHAEIVLQSVTNIENFPKTEGNSFKLAQIPQGCKIEIWFYGESGKNKENYIFKNDQLLYAARYMYNYSDGGISNISENKGKFNIHLAERIELMPNQKDVIQNFENYLRLFPKQAIKTCQETKSR